MFRCCTVCDESFVVVRKGVRRGVVKGFGRVSSVEGVLFHQHWFCNGCWSLIMGGVK